MERYEELDEAIFIEEHVYQKMKKKLNKKDDWLRSEELKKYYYMKFYN